MVHPLKRWREDRGLTQGDAAKALKLNSPTLCRYENGSRLPSLTRAAQLSKKTGIPIDKFLGEAKWPA